MANEKNEEDPDLKELDDIAGDGLKDRPTGEELVEMNEERQPGPVPLGDDQNKEEGEPKKKKK